MLIAGIHQIGSRAPDENRTWGVTHFEPLLVLNLPPPPLKTVGLKYLFDDDPDFGLDFLNIIGDLNGDSVVSTANLLVFLAYFGTSN